MSVSPSASTPASAVPVHLPYDGPEDSFEGRCPVCGLVGHFVRDRLSISESYRCSSCRGHLRYQGQARAMLRALSRRGSRSLAELVREPEFRRMRIFEPGTMGPFRRLLQPLDGYVQSIYDPAVARGRERDGLRCEDLMQLTFESGTFDLVVTSDIFEHVRHPRRGFAEIFRVLKPGGSHIFTVPGTWPLRQQTVERVDVTGDEDVLVLPPKYHNREHLLYNDFGLDLLDLLDEIGFVTDPMLFASESATTSAQVTFCSQRPGGPAGDRSAGEVAAAGIRPERLRGRFRRLFRRR